jgi:hypothetical protein
MNDPKLINRLEKLRNRDRMFHMRNEFILALEDEEYKDIEDVREIISLFRNYLNRKIKILSESEVSSSILKIIELCDSNSEYYDLFMAVYQLLDYWKIGYDEFNNFFTHYFNFNDEVFPLIDPLNNYHNIKEVKYKRIIKAMIDTCDNKSRVISSLILKSKEKEFISDYCNEWNYNIEFQKAIMEIRMEGFKIN